MHVHSLLKKLDGKVQSKIGKILLCIIYVLVILAGCFAFSKTQVYFYHFNTGNWKNGGRKYCDFVSGIYRNYFVNVEFFFQKK